MLELEKEEMVLPGNAVGESDDHLPRLYARYCVSIIGLCGKSKMIFCKVSGTNKKKRVKPQPFRQCGDLFTYACAVL